nr:reverse transcriptase domain-containing protein [Tanacetum cinerariifolium]
MLTHSSFNLPVETPLNPSTSNPKRRNCRRSKQPFILEESPVDTMADQRTMAELLRAPIEGYAEAIVVPSILAEQFELKHSLINMMTSDQFFGLEKDNPHDHIRVNEANMKAMQTQINNVKNGLRNEMKKSIQASMSNQTNELKNMMASFFQMNTASTLGSGSLPSNTVANPKGELKAITTRSSIVLDGPFVPIPPSFINPKEDERVKEILTDQDLAKYTIKVPPPLVQKSKPSNQTSVCVTTGTYNQVAPQNRASNFMAPPGFAPDQSSTSSTLSSNTIPNPKGEMKAINTRSGVAYKVTSIPTLKKLVEQETEEIMDKEQTNFQRSTAHIQPPVTSISESDVLKTLPKPNIPYPSRLNDQKLCEKATNQMDKFFQIFQDLHFDISFADDLLLMPKFASTIKRRSFLRVEVSLSTSATSTHTNVHAKENNNDQAEEGEQLQDDEFTNPLCAPT